MNPLTLAVPIVAAIAPALPDAISSLWDWFTSTEDGESYKEQPKIVHKKHDSHKFTQKEYSFICDTHAYYTNMYTQAEITSFLNERLSLDKSITSYSTIWRGKTIFKLLPVGDLNFNAELPRQLGDYV